MIYARIDLMDALKSWESDLAIEWRQWMVAHPEASGEEYMSQLSWKKLDLLQALIELEKEGRAVE